MINNELFAQIETSGVEFPAVVLERTEIRTLHSLNVGEDYEIFISLPMSYEQLDINYPVIYITDSYRAFSTLKGLTDAFILPHKILPEVILVGIGYGGKGQDALLNWVVGRTRDLTPVKNTTWEEYYENRVKEAGIEDIEIQTGGAALFLDFIRDELFPFIESNYRVDSSRRVFGGYSAGGLFGLYVLFHQPHLFSKYFLGSPSIVAFSDSTAFEFEKHYATTHSDLEAEVFMSSGKLEKTTGENMIKMANRLNSRNYKSLVLETFIFEGENHVTCMPAALARGFVELFNNQDSK